MSVQIMWKEIAIGLIVLLAIRNLLDLYMINKYKKIISRVDIMESGTTRQEAERLLKMADFFSVGPWKKSTYDLFDGLCWLLSSIALMEGDEKQFLNYMENIKREHEFEMKSFVLALYYRSKNELDIAMKWYNNYMETKHNDKDMETVLKGIFEMKKDETFEQSINSFKNPALIQLIKDNRVINKGMNSNECDI